MPPGPPQESAEKFLKKQKDLRVLNTRPDKIRGIDVWRVEAEAGLGRYRVEARGYASMTTGFSAPPPPTSNRSTGRASLARKSPQARATARCGHENIVNLRQEEVLERRAVWNR